MHLQNEDGVLSISITHILSSFFILPRPTILCLLFFSSGGSGPIPAASSSQAPPRPPSEWRAANRRGLLLPALPVASSPRPLELASPTGGRMSGSARRLPRGGGFHGGGARSSSLCSCVGDSPRGPHKQRGNPHLKPATKPKHAKPNHAGA
jgi:hypothetical protein